jgi:hypothetical protein
MALFAHEMVMIPARAPVVLGVKVVVMVHADPEVSDPPQLVEGVVATV